MYCAGGYQVEGLELSAVAAEQAQTLKSGSYTVRLCPEQLACCLFDHFSKGTLVELLRESGFELQNCDKNHQRSEHLMDGFNAY